ncbi:MAG: flagella basal body P-ring formation protein FlgA [Propionibacteriaceae bacterium]|nr:flagella basal body P-ring formation protein FlgA [Propionibacteriaceae bacterium]
MDTTIARLRRFLSWHRRTIAALLAGLAVFALANQLSPRPADLIPAVTLAHTVYPGTVLTEADLTVTQLPSTALPEQHYGDIADLVGQTLGFGLAKGTIVQPGMLAAAPTLAEGRALVPILIRDNSLRDMLTPGTAVTLVIAESSEVVTADARVSALPGKEEGSLLSPSTSKKPLVLVDVPADLGPSVSALGQSGQLAVILS